jgi:hypothetical protein
MYCKVGEWNKAVSEVVLKSLLNLSQVQSSVHFKLQQRRERRLHVSGVVSCRVMS